MKSKRLLMLVFGLVLVAFLANLVLADEIKLLCLDEGDSIEFSKCNEGIADRECTSSGGCQYCVKEVSPGVYCPMSLNACNSEELTCGSEDEGGINEDNSDDNNDDSNNEDDNKKATVGAKFNSQVVKSADDVETNEDGEKISLTKQQTKDNKVFYFIGMFLIELFIFAALIYFISSKKKGKKK